MSLTPDAMVDDPVASASSRFPLDGSTFTPRREDVASPVGVRPFGLRRTRSVGAGRPLPVSSYDAQRQLRVDADGRPLIELPMAGDPTANKTESVDGEDGPSSVDWIND